MQIIAGLKLEQWIVEILIHKNTHFILKFNFDYKIFFPCFLITILTFHLEYPWTEALEKGLREWLFLPNFQEPPTTSKVVGKVKKTLFLF